jgi:hypothetical protein
MGAKKKGKHGKRGAKKARGKAVTFRGKLFGIGKRGRKVTFKANRAAFDVASFMDGARDRASKKQLRALAKARAAKARKAAKKTGKRGKGGKKGGRKASRSKKRPLGLQAQCVKRVVAVNKSRGYKYNVKDVMKFCGEMTQAGRKAFMQTSKEHVKAGVRAAPRTPSEAEAFARKCRGDFKTILGGQMERLEEKYCRAGWSREQVRASLKAISGQLAAA